LTRSSESLEQVCVLFTFLSLFISFKIGRLIQPQNDSAALFLAFAFMLVPLNYVLSYRGQIEPIHYFFVLLIIYLYFKESSWIYLAFGVAATIKPFSLCLAPLLIQTYVKNSFAQNTAKRLRDLVCFSLLAGGPLLLHMLASKYQTDRWINVELNGAGGFDQNLIAGSSYLHKLTLIVNSYFFQIQEHDQIFFNFSLVILATIIGLYFLLIHTLKKDFRSIPHCGPLAICIALNFILISLGFTYFPKYMQSAYACTFVIFAIIASKYPIALLFFAFNQAFYFTNVSEKYDSLLNKALYLGNFINGIRTIYFLLLIQVLFYSFSHFKSKANFHSKLGTSYVTENL
jgi:hypothetical protein